MAASAQNLDNPENKMASISLPDDVLNRFFEPFTFGFSFEDNAKETSTRQTKRACNVKDKLYARNMYEAVEDNARGKWLSSNEPRGFYTVTDIHQGLSP